MICRSEASAIVIGAGIAGASAAWALAERGSVTLLEQADSAGYHASGRSASVLSETSGHRIVCALAAASRPFLEFPPDGFVDHSLLSPRGLLWVGEETDAELLDELACSAHAIAPSVRRLTPAQVLELVPQFRPHAVAGGGTFEPDAMAIDTDALLQAFLRGFRRRDGRLITSSEAVELRRVGDSWEVITPAQTLRAQLVVNAAGAWGDVIAERAGVAVLGLEPRRRTACVAALADVDARLPLVMDVAGRYYFQPEAGGLLISPADATLSAPCDAQAEEIDVALALERIQGATTLPVRSVRRAWAGLRTFTPDAAPVVGEDPDAVGFWWLVGQGGGGIKTAPAMAEALARMVHEEPLPRAITDRHVSVADLSPARFRASV